MTPPFSFIPISVDDLEQAESSDEFTNVLVLNPSNKGQIIEFNGSNSRCNDNIYGQILVHNGIVKDFYLDRKGCSLSRACIVAFSQQLINVPVSSVLSITEADLLKAAGTTHPMRDECVLFGIKAVQKVLRNL